MKKIIFIIAIYANVASLFSACPTGYAAVADKSNVFVVVPDGASCPAGYELVSCPEVIPIIDGQTGSDAKGTFTYGSCSYN